MLIVDFKTDLVLDIITFTVRNFVDYCAIELSIIDETITNDEI